jgi:hypothetical protein
LRDQTFFIKNFDWGTKIFLLKNSFGGSSIFLTKFSCPPLLFFLHFFEKHVIFWHKFSFPYLFKFSENFAKSTKFDIPSKSPLAQMSTAVCEDFQQIAIYQKLRWRLQRRCTTNFFQARRRQRWQCLRKFGKSNKNGRISENCDVNFGKRETFLLGWGYW